MAPVIARSFATLMLKNAYIIGLVIVLKDKKAALDIASHINLSVK